MKSRNYKACILASTLLAGAGALSPALAQDANQEGTAASTTQSAADDVVVVTGSRIQSANLVSTSPVTQVSSEELDLRGVVRVEDMLNTLPQAFAAQGSAISNGATGTATVNLRGLGAVRTLVLVNGRRLPFGSPGAGGVPPDLNQVPSALVERVEVLTGGASAVYGSDALAGVVNFIMMDDFEGVRIDTQYSFYQHKNDNSTIQSLINEFGATNPSQFKLPDDNVLDGETFEITGVMGVNTPDGRGNVTAFAGYRNVDPVLQADRDYSGCAFGTRNNGTEFTCSGSSTNQIANFLDFTGQAPTGIWFRTSPQGEFIARDFTSDTFNFNPFNYYQRPDETYRLGAFAHYEINEHFEPYAELSFMDNRTVAQIAPSGVFGGGVAGQSGGINCNNPFLSDQQVDFLCRQGRGFTDAEIAAGAIAEDVIILRRNVEGGNRRDDLQHNAYRGVVGVRGEAFAGFDYDIYASWSKVTLTEDYENELSIQKTSKALNAVDDGSGNIVCAVNADSNPANDDPACVPYDIFSGNGPSDAALNYIVSPLLQRGETNQQVVSASIFGDLGQYGMQSPMADNGVAIALGTEYRRDYLDRLPDAGFQSGDGFGQGGPTNPVSGSTDVWEIFGELQVPLIENRPGFESLTFEAAYRYSDYSSGFQTDTYKLAADWSPVSDFRFRGSYQRAVRAPNVIELFSTQGIGLFDLNQNANGLYDPCAGDFDPNSATPEPARSEAECARTGVAPGDYGNIADNPAGQFNVLTGGNPNLDPESADTYALGVVGTPSFLPGLSFSIDYFNIEIEDTISTIPPAAALQNCLDSGDPVFCDLINRGNGSTLWANPTGFVEALNINTGSLKTSGVDITAAYSFDIGTYGGLGFDLVGTWLDELETVDFPGDTAYDCVGFYGSICGTPNPEWRHKLRATWSTPWDVRVSASWRYYDSVDIAATSDNPKLTGGFSEINKTLDSQNYFDLSGSWQVRENATLRLGVNNIFDREPPLSAAVGAGFGNGNTFPQVYDSLGRYVFAGATVDF